MLKLPVFETPRLILREVQLSDAKAYEEHFADYEVIQHLSSAVPWPYPQGEAKNFLEKFILPAQGKDRWMWGIFLKEKPEVLIGCVDLWREARPENRGFWLGKAYWGRGIMSEAVAPIMDYAFSELGFEKVILTNAVGNLRSRRIKEKSGARLIELRPASFVRSDYTQTELWEMTKENWLNHKNSDRKRLVLISAIIASTVIFDQVTKIIARQNLVNRGTLRYLNDVFVIQYSENTGAFLSLGSDLPENVRFLIFSVMVGALLAYLGFSLIKDKLAPLHQTVAMSLMLGGGVGNLIDRVGRGSVTDFLNLGIGNLRTGIFNVADIAVTAAAVIMLLAAVKNKKLT